jgi:hypothetical protein
LSCNCFVGAVPVRAAGEQRTYTLSGMFCGFAERYFFFRLDVFFAVFLDAFAVFLDFFAFLAMFPSSLMLVQCKSTFDMHKPRLHHNCKIDTARFEEGKQPPHRRNLRPEIRSAD